MRRVIVSFVIALIGTLSVAQSSSPEALYDRGLDALSGAGPAIWNKPSFGLLPAAAARDGMANWTSGRLRRR